MIELLSVPRRRICGKSDSKSTRRNFLKKATLAMGGALGGVEQLSDGASEPGSRVTFATIRDPGGKNASGDRQTTFSDYWALTSLLVRRENPENPFD